MFLLFLVPLLKISVLHCGMIRTRVGWAEIRFKKRGNVVIRGFAATDCSGNPSELKDRHYLHN